MTEPKGVDVPAERVDAGAPSADPLHEVRMEMAAIDEIVRNLAPLPPESRQKVWRYVTDWVAKTMRGSGGDLPREPSVLSSGSSRVSAAGTVTPGPAPAAGGGPTIESFGTLAELFAAADPKTDADRALVAAVWLQEHDAQQEISPQTVNRELSHLGYRVLNITRAFDVLRGSKPQLVVQLRKEGSTKQARKTFKVTHEGKKVIERRLRGEVDE